MKISRILLVAALFFAFSFGLCAQEVVLQNANDKTVSFTTTGISGKKKEAVDAALRNLYQTLFYVGVDGLMEGQPLANSPENNTAYLDKFIQDRAPFYGSVSVISNEKINKMYKAKVLVSLPIATLIKELENNQVRLKKVEVSTLKNLPTIMVVPYRMQGESYKYLLEEDFDRRIAVSKVQEGFVQRGVVTNDFEAWYNALSRSFELDVESKYSSDADFLKRGPTDVYVTVDINKKFEGAYASIALIMKAYETSTGKVLASSQGWTNQFATNATDVLCAYAVEDNLQNFLNDICKAFEKGNSTGSTCSMQVVFAQNSRYNMSSKVGENGYTMQNEIRQWVRKNAVEYHLKGVMDLSMTFDMLTIPALDEDGLKMDVVQFAFLLENYLRGIGISSSSKIDGNAILFSIE